MINYLPMSLGEFLFITFLGVSLICCGLILTLGPIQIYFSQFEIAIDQVIGRLIMYASVVGVCIVTELLFYFIMIKWLGIE